MKAVIILSNEDVCLQELRIPVRTRQGFHLLLSHSPSLLGFLRNGKGQIAGVTPCDNLFK